MDRMWSLMICFQHTTLKTKAARYYTPSTLLFFILPILIACNFFNWAGLASAFYTHEIQEIEKGAPIGLNGPLSLRSKSKCLAH